MNTDHESQGQTPPPGPVLSQEQLKAKLSLYVGSLPSTVLEDLFQTLKSMGLTEPKVDEIIEKTLKTYSGQESNARMDELMEKMNGLEDTLIRALKNIETMETRRETAQGQEESKQEMATPQPTQSLFDSPPPPQRSRRAPEQEEEEKTEDSSEEEPVESSFGFPGKRNKVLLPDVPDSAINNAVLLKWVEFLLETVGHQNLPEVLDYYVDIGWISEKVTMKLLAYASGMVAPRGRAKEKLSTKDHLRSLLFIEKLRGKDFDQSKLTRLEREIEYTIEKRIRHD